MNAYGQIHPANGDTVNYRMVGFKVPEKKNTTGYILEVHEYLVRDDGTVHTKFLFEQQSDNNKIVATVPAFGKSYKWQVKYLQKEKVTDSTGFNIFSVGSIAYTDTNKYRMRIVTNKLGGRDYFLFVDGTRTMYDMNGNALWYLPNIQGIVDDKTSIRDMELTPFNTITFLTVKDACEVDYDGNILWRAPDDGKVSGDSSEKYHHEFTRLKSGNYMVAGSKIVPRLVPENVVLSKDDTRTFKKGEDMYKNILSATIIEYNKSGEILWFWVALNHFSDADIFTVSPHGKLKTNTHMNSFYFDEKSNIIYTSHRNISRIVKIAYPSGSIIKQYGNNDKSKDITGNGLFYGQHSCKLGVNNQMYLFNNNMNMEDSSKKVSTILFFKEPVQVTDTLEIAWEFSCDIDALSTDFTPGGGGVSELTTGDVLVCMAKGRHFIVSKSKQVLCPSVPTALSNQIKVTVLTSVANTTKNSGISLFPNPNQGSFTLKGSIASAEVDIEILNAVGQVVYRQSAHTRAGELQHDIRLSGLADGIYMVRIHGQGEEASIRFKLTN